MSTESVKWHAKCKPKQGWCKPVQGYERNNVNQFSLTFPNLSTFFRESHEGLFRFLKALIEIKKYNKQALIKGFFL